MRASPNKKERAEMPSWTADREEAGEKSWSHIHQTDQKENRVCTVCLCPCLFFRASTKSQVKLSGKARRTTVQCFETCVVCHPSYHNSLSHLSHLSHLSMTSSHGERVSERAPHCWIHAIQALLSYLLLLN